MILLSIIPIIPNINLHEKRLPKMGRFIPSTTSLLDFEHETKANYGGSWISFRRELYYSPLAETLVF